MFMRFLKLLPGIVCAAAISSTAFAAEKKPNILVIWGDDIGWFNVSAYNRGMMGYKTPNIDRIANDGILFTDAYGQNSCTAGRASFVTGQSPFRTGLLKVGLPGAKEGLSSKDITVAEVLKNMGYATGQFGKNHWVTLMSIYPQITVLTNFLVTYTTLMPKKNPKTKTIQKTQNLRRSLAHVALFIAMQMAKLKILAR